MTKPQIWVAAFLALFLILFVLSRITDQSELHNKGTMNPQDMMGQGQTSGKQLTPAEMVSSLGCVNCHGADLAGTNKAPSLLKVKDNWSRQELINYLRNPQSYMDSERFQEFKTKYPGVIMPAFNNIDIKDLGKIADYLLAK
ncbi:MAG TPA: cytochrome c [Ignavibacteriaceae bacterium]|nr:cytochrome c [Ignavibacteriaceae bacterium]